MILHSQNPRRLYRLAPLCGDDTREKEELV